MKKKIISFVLLGLSINVIGCSNIDAKNSYNLELKELEIEEIEKKFNLEKITEESLQTLNKERILETEAYIEKRGKNLGGKVVTRKDVNLIIERAEFLVDKFYNDESKKTRYLNMSTINNIDSIGFYLNESLALSFFKESIDYFKIDDLNEKIMKNDEDLCEYFYKINFLYDYYNSRKEQSTTIFTITIYLYSLIEYVNIKTIYESNSLKSVINKNLLKKDLESIEETFFERDKSLKALDLFE